MVNCLYLLFRAIKSLKAFDDFASKNRAHKKDFFAQSSVASVAALGRSETCSDIPIDRHKHPTLKYFIGGAMENSQGPA